MNKNAIQKFAIWARNELIAQVSQRAYQYGIDESGFGDVSADTLNGRLLTAEEKFQRQELIKQIKEKGYKQVMEEVAYTWFNRFIALRFMEVNNYLPSHIRVFSDASGTFKPEILNDVLHLDLPGLDSGKVAEYIESNDTEALYRYLLLTQCNALNSALPVMFERMGGYTEMLLPNNILRQDSVLGHMVSDIPEEDWQDAVQIIGWLYQYYNTELKDDTFAQLKKNVKITKERIPAATQLFTPDWIVRYMVENSLGRLWLEGHPNAELHDGWKYYLDEAKQEPDVEAQLAKLREEYKTIKPEEIKVIDPCMGSGHILVYAFDVLMQIYTSAGWDQREAAQSILKNNLYGLDIDDRAAQLAYFAVMMKARQYDRRLLTRGIQPNIFSIRESNGINRNQLKFFGWSMSEIERNTALTQLEYLLDTFRDAKEYGSILNVDMLDWGLLYRFVGTVDYSEQISMDELNLEGTKDALWNLVELGAVLAQKYDVVVTNPPYMAVSNAGAKVNDYVKKNFPDSKADMFAVFIERCGQMAKQGGYQAMITQHAWMFLSSFEKLRTKLLEVDIVNMAHLGARAFEEIGGEVVQTTSFVIRKSHIADYKGEYCRLIEPTSQQGKEDMFLAGENRYAADQSNFSKIPGSPVAYWLSEKFIGLLSQEKTIGKTNDSGSGLSTADNERFLRFFWEVNAGKIANGKKDEKKWYLFHKGGEYRKWYGNLLYVVNWENDGSEIKYWVTHNPKDPNTTSWSRRIFNTHLYFQKGITWSVISSGDISFRVIDENAMISNAAGGIFGFSSNEERDAFMAALNTKVWTLIFSTINPTLNYSSGVIQKAPCPRIIDSSLGSKCVSDSKVDWDSFETSWDFKRNPLASGNSLSATYVTWKQECEARFQQLKKNEEELNRIFIDIYGLQDELTPDVADKDVTVHRVFDSKDDVPESMKGSNYVRAMRDEIVSLISYAVGCMFGRYSLDVDGLAHAGGEWDASKYKTIIPDSDNIIPICDDEYFDDDITGRFVEFVRKVYGDDTLEENLKFVADALGGKGTPREVIRSYFLNDFYADHLKTYQKRPIYWLFDSGKKNGFKALCYMHRYQRDLLARLRTDYVHEQQERYRTQLAQLGDAIDHASASERVKLTKQQKKFQDQATELQKYEEKVHHLADQNIEIDLDDGVKHNYELFADVLAKIK